MSTAQRVRPDFYEKQYENLEAASHRAVREETWGEDLGQTGWATAEESDELLAGLELAPGSRILEIACGSGGLALRAAERHGADATGVDIDPEAVAAASERAHRAGRSDRVRYLYADADHPLPFPSGSFDAILCNDAINHLRWRPRTLAEMWRLLSPGGRVLFTDPVVVTGALTADEITARSSIGFFLFTPRGENERLLEDTGFTVLAVEDRTEGVENMSRRWADARERRRRALVAVEGRPGYERWQRFLRVVHLLASQRRLSRFSYLAQK